MFSFWFVAECVSTILSRHVPNIFGKGIYPTHDSGVAPTLPSRRGLFLAAV